MQTTAKQKDLLFIIKNFALKITFIKFKENVTFSSHI